MNIYKKEVTNIHGIDCTFYLKVGDKLRLSRLRISKSGYHFFAFIPYNRSLNINRIKWFSV